MVYRLLMTTVVIGMAGVAVGMMDSTFKHYYRKYADYEDMKNTGVQEVTFVGEPKERRTKKAASIGARASTASIARKPSIPEMELSRLNSRRLDKIPRIGIRPTF